MNFSVAMHKCKDVTSVVRNEINFDILECLCGCMKLECSLEVLPKVN